MASRVAGRLSAGRRPELAVAGVAAALAAGLYVATRDKGSYYPGAWPYLGAAVAVAAVALFILGRRPNRWIAIGAGGLVALGLWTLLSTAWGGNPDDAWQTFDQTLIGAGALLTGALLVTGNERLRAGLLAGVLGGMTLQAIELLYRLQAGPVPADWFHGRKIQGAVGYANAQASFCAVGIPLALWLACNRRVAVRVAGGVSAGLLTGALLLTQSRGAVLAVGIVLVLQAALARDLRLLALEFLLVVAAGALWFPLRHVDAGLVSDKAHRLTALRHFVGWTVLAAALLALAASLSPDSRRLRRAFLLGTAGLAVVILIGGVADHKLTPGKIRSTLKRAAAEKNPSELPGGTTRLGSLSLTGRVVIWKVAWHQFTRKPLTGIGRGRFAAAWGVHRDNKDLYVLQPHSAEMEVLSELGVIGALLALVFVVGTLAGCFRGPRAPPGVWAAGISVFAVVALQASVDWTLSFPALTVATLLVVGACAVPGRLVATPRWQAAAVAAAGVLVFAAMAGQYLAVHRLGRAEAASTPSDAWRLAQYAHSIDPWNSDVVDYQGQLAEQSGQYLLAASLYARASSLALQPWVDEYNRARALSRAGLRRQSRDACRSAIAENPLERTLQAGVCDGVD